MALRLRNEVIEPGNMNVPHGAPSNRLQRSQVKYHQYSNSFVLINTLLARGSFHYYIPLPFISFYYYD